jgi:hypothetical protein
MNQGQRRKIRRYSTLESPRFNPGNRCSSQDLDFELFMKCPAAVFLEDLGGGKAFSVIVKGCAGAAISDQVSIRATQMRDEGVDLEFLGGAADWRVSSRPA